MNLTKIDFFDNITPENIKAHSEVNIKNIKKSIHDLSFDSEKILICGRGENIHPEFTPRFTTPSTMIESDLYVTVDHHPPKKEYFTKKGKYALSLIVHPDVPKKILELGGEIFWFSPQYLENDLPKIISGVYTMDNSGLSAISLANYFNANSILLSGIKLSNMYEKFLEGKDLVFQTILKNNSKIFSLDGILAEQITFDDWKIS
ncbi:MAG: hypothetical protein CXT78_07955 [Thaumarchaeota archaeon]|jgi:hypothetical protein|nr:MAG: hypothetical protein CXT78_07955 [Nitrososphaerota archaeon]|tara:strand:+ start:444 stop:1055 length:612 start_codon:yes stop_codon:yes gene_type:complete